MQSAAEETAGQARKKLSRGLTRAIFADGAWIPGASGEDLRNSCPDGAIIDEKAFIARVMRPSGISGLTVDESERSAAERWPVHSAGRYR